MNLFAAGFEKSARKFLRHTVGLGGWAGELAHPAMIAFGSEVFVEDRFVDADRFQQASDAVFDLRDGSHQLSAVLYCCTPLANLLFRRVYFEYFTDGKHTACFLASIPLVFLAVRHIGVILDGY